MSESIKVLRNRLNAANHHSDLLLDQIDEYRQRISQWQQALQESVKIRSDLVQAIHILEKSCSPTA